MGNPLPPNLKTGTIGEILVQLRLLEYGIQASPPIKDSGNDLIAIKDEVVKFVQVKTSTRKIRTCYDLPKVYHIVALVELKLSEVGDLLLDKTIIYLYKKGQTISDKQLLTKDVALSFWSE